MILICINGTQAIRVAIAEVIQMFDVEPYHLARALRDRTGLMFEQCLAARTAFLFV